MMADFAGPGVDARFRALLVKAKPIKWGFFHHPLTSTYVRDRVLIMGDSAHASLPFQAAGAAQGVEDAVVLSNVLQELAQKHEANEAHDKVEKNGEDLLKGAKRALEAYDEVRRPRAQKQLEQSAEVGRMIMFQHEEAGSDMETILPMLQKGRFEWLWFHNIEEDVQKAVSRLKERWTD